MSSRSRNGLYCLTISLAAAYSGKHNWFSSFNLSYLLFIFICLSTMYCYTFSGSFQFIIILCLIFYYLILYNLYLFRLFTIISLLSRIFDKYNWHPHDTACEPVTILWAVFFFPNYEEDSQNYRSVCIYFSRAVIFEIYWGRNAFWQKKYRLMDNNSIQAVL